MGVLVLTLGVPVGAQDATAEPSPTATSTGPRSLPRDLTPSLKDAPTIRPRAYEDGCHVQAGQRRPRVCSYGVEDGAYSVLLIGDSHAVQWLPALEAIAEQEGWRLYSVTKSACPVPDTPIIVRGERLRDCPPWRDAAFERIAELHPDLVIAASLGRIYELPNTGTDAGFDRKWRDAWVESLEALQRGAEHVVLLGDTPMWREDPIVCLDRHRKDIDRCDTPRRRAISSRTEEVERAAAEEAGVSYVPTADLVCPDDPCRAVEGRYLVLGDTQHMTVAWARSIAQRLLERLPCEALPVVTGAPAPSIGPSSAPGASATPPSPSPSAVPDGSPVADPSAAPASSPGVSCSD